MRGTPDLVRYESDGVTKTAATGMVRLGSERRPPNAPGWDSEQTTGPIDIVAFSLRPVRVRFEDERPVVLCPGLAALPGASTHYRRTPTCDAGQRTVFIGLPGRTFADVLGEGAREQRDQSRFFAPADPRACAIACRLERLVFGRADELSSEHADALLIDEAATEIIGRSIQAPESARTRERPLSPATRRRWRDLANEAAVALTRDPANPPTLDNLADSLEISPAYLTRVFRREFGQTMHRCYSVARIVRTLEQLPDAKGRLTALALANGFASHAHMTVVFRQTLGVTPSGLSADSAAALRRDLAG